MADAISLETVRKLIGDGRLKEASEACRKLIDAGGDPEALYLLAVATGEDGLYSESLTLFENAVNEFPDRADIFYNFGTVLMKMGKTDEAIARWSRAVEINPGYAEAHFNLGHAYSDGRMWPQALDHYQRVCALHPDNPDAFYNAGNILFRIGKMDEAKYCFEQAVSIDPGYIQGWINLGLAELRQGDPVASIRALRKATEKDSDNVLAHFNLGQALLLDGRLKEGFAEAEWRRRIQELPFPVSGQSPWEGGDIAGKKILLYGEQGQGDVIHFLRYAKVLADRGVWVGVYCHEGLAGLAANAKGVEKAASFSDEPPPFDTFAPLMSLPHLLELTETDEIPAAPYITPPPSLSLPGGEGGIRVGLVWAGNPEHDNDINRSAKPDDFRPLLELEEIGFYSLQVGDAAQGIKSAGLDSQIADLGSGFNDFTDAAAVIQALDLVISVDTAVPHLAGALGKTVWLLLPRVPDWRWSLEGEKTPWYPSMRLFRQQGLRDWGPVIERIRDELRNFSRHRGA